MESYIITKAKKGYLIRGQERSMGAESSEVYAFSTLKEAQDHLPELFEPKIMEQGVASKRKHGQQ